MARIGIALSGGGHRAALCGLGALLYFIDAEKNREVTSIASVSGGSLTNGYMAQAGGYCDMPKADLRKHAQAFAHQVSTRGTVWACLGTWVYLFVTVTTLV